MYYELNWQSRPQKEWPHLSLAKKIEQLLWIILPRTIKVDLVLPDIDANIDSESDYEDDYIWSEYKKIVEA